MIHFTKGSFLWKWSSPERILQTLPFFIYRFFRTYVQHKVRDSDQDSSHPAHGRGKESGSRLPQDDLGKVPWQLWQKPWTSQSWALSRSSPASLGRVMWACPHSRRRVLGFSTGTAISWEHKADAPDFLLSWMWPPCLCYWLTLIGVFWL